MSRTSTAEDVPNAVQEGGKTKYRYVLKIDSPLWAKMAAFWKAEGYESRTDMTRALIYMGLVSWENGEQQAPSTQELASAFVDESPVEQEFQELAGNLTQVTQVRFSPEQIEMLERVRHEVHPAVKPQVIVRRWVDEGIKRYRRRLAEAKARRQSA